MLERKRRWSVAALVFFGHVLLLLLLDESMQEEPRSGVDSRRSLLFFLTPPKRLPQVQTGSLSDIEQLELPQIAVPPLPRIETPAAPSAHAPRIDWQGEAHESVSNAIREKQAADALKFSEASKAPSKKCAKPKAPEWRSETPTHGFSGGLPYVRFHDDRCIFVVIFFGCGFGAKPQADSHLFDNMHNYPNDSSVPDLDECEESP